MTKIAIMFGVFLLPGVAAAHAEHSTGGTLGLVHFLTDPFHVGLTVVATLIFLAARKAMLGRRTLDRLGE